MYMLEFNHVLLNLETLQNTHQLRLRNTLSIATAANIIALIVKALK